MYIEIDRFDFSLKVELATMKPMILVKLATDHQYFSSLLTLVCINIIIVVRSGRMR
jgi:hypothetical protein